MIKVYIWNYRGTSDAWGHASMDLGGQYISWWPMSTGRVSSKLHRNVYSVHPIGRRTFGDDTRAEGRPPNPPIEISGLDEKRILGWWRKTAMSWGGGRSLGPPTVPWSSLGWNCAKIVATALREGGGDQFANWSKSWNIVWTPNDVREYAQSIKGGLASRAILKSTR